MEFTAKYTTQKLILADKKGEEAKKTPVSDDIYALCEMITELNDKLIRLGNKLK